MARQRLSVRLGARALTTRRIVRAPILLYRIGLGFLFGTRLLMLEHIGRSTGARRYVVLEVVDRPTADQYIVVAGFGPRTQWLRNITVHPEVRISTGFRRRRRGLATALSDTESRAALDNYVQRHPKAWAQLRATIEAVRGAPVDTLPMVRIDLNR